MYVIQQSTLNDIYCIKATNRPLMLQNPGSSFVIWFIVFEGSRDRNHSPYAIGDISSDYLKRVSVHRFISNHKSTTLASGFTLAGTKKRKDNNTASTLTYDQPAGSVSISFAKPTFGLTINEDKPSFLKPQVSLDSSEKIRWYDLNQDLS